MLPPSTKLERMIGASRACNLRHLGKYIGTGHYYIVNRSDTDSESA
jgi:hypothetical protein